MANPNWFVENLAVDPKILGLSLIIIIFFGIYHKREFESQSFVKIFTDKFFI